jgi:hypothetical protein
MGVLNWLFPQAIETSKRRDNVVLLVRVRRTDHTIEDRRHVDDRSQVQTLCDNVCKSDETKEVWVFQKIYHHCRAEGEQLPPDKKAEQVSVLNEINE